MTAVPHEITDLPTRVDRGNREAVDQALPNEIWQINIFTFQLERLYRV